MIYIECGYCEKLNRGKDFIYETNHWKIFLWPDQGYLGRCVIVLKRHCESLAELKQEELSDFIKIVKNLESSLKKSFGATMFNWTCLMNKAYRNSPYNPHLHWHFRPRYNHKIEFKGILFTDQEFGYHYNKEKKQEISNNIINEIIQKIKENLYIY